MDWFSVARLAVLFCIAVGIVDIIFKKYWLAASMFVLASAGLLAIVLIYGGAK